MSTSLARLVFPSLRWRQRTGFAHERPKVDAALARGVGGFIVFQGTRDVVAALTRDLRQQAGRPLLIGSDLERGAAQQFVDLTDMPTPAALGFVDDLDATHAVALMTAREARAVGINWNFAPVCDLDLEPRNPIVQTRAFGADPGRVGRHAAAYVCGSQEHGVLVCAKHYPGHGRTIVDSHETLPVVAAPLDELLRVDVQPFAHAIREGVGSVMTAHVAYPGWAPGNRAATFAPEILGYLRDPLKFDGVVVTDALIMAGALAVYAEADATVAAVAAGCDALLYPRDFGAVITALDAAVGKALPVARADDALERYENAVGAWGRGDAGPSGIDLASHQAFADGIATRALHMVRGDPAKLSGTVEVAVIDDDVGGPYTVGPRDILEKTLRESGMRMAQRAPRNVQRLIALYSEPRSWKNRADLGERTLRALRSLVPQASLVVLFGHPRLAAQIPGSAPVLCAWHGQPVMQRAAARFVTRNA
ncbi:MAG TPA: glycoside hydrolase family 3 N-terminal domain-containing protein [Gemmatimonadales bacterium]